MKTALTSRLNYLRTRLHADFGDDDAQTVWLDNGDSTYTKISILQTSARPSQKDLTGLLTLPTGAIQFYILKSAWPAVKLDDCFLLGPPAAGDATTPHADTLTQKYRVTACPASPQLAWQRIEAERH